MKARNILKRLQLLSLSLESAIQSDELESVNPILTERADLIGQLEVTPLDARMTECFADLRRIDDRVASLLTATRSEIANQVRSASGRTNSVRSYSANREATLAEQAR